MSVRKRYNVSGIFIFDQFEDEEKRSPTVFEDCTKETQRNFVDTLDHEACKRLSMQLAETLRNVVEQVCEPEEENGED